MIPNGPGQSRELRPDLDQGDELWHFNEPAPPGINAGTIRIAIVLNGESISTTHNAIR